MVAGISNHEHARKWQPGAGGLCMHTILRDGNRVHLGISTGGHYLSEDGGQTFVAANQGVGAGLRPIRIPNSVSACTRSSATRPRPGASTCRITAAGPIGADLAGRAPTSACCAATTTAKRGDRSPRACQPILASRSSCTRTTPTRSTSCRSSRRRALARAAPAVWRSESGGRSWNRLARGMAKTESYFTVLRDAMDIDHLRSPALYFGTTTGQLWIGRDGGEEWSCLFNSLPPIHCVKVAVV